MLFECFDRAKPQPKIGNISNVKQAYQNNIKL